MKQNLEIFQNIFSEDSLEIYNYFLFSPLMDFDAFIRAVPSRTAMHDLY